MLIASFRTALILLAVILLARFIYLTIDDVNITVASLLK